MEAESLASAQALPRFTPPRTTCLEEAFFVPCALVGLPLDLLRPACKPLKYQVAPPNRLNLSLTSLQPTPVWKAMLPDDIFPLEIWVKILALLDPKDILNYQSVCKIFYHWTRTIPSLQLCLELHAAGYVEAINYRKGISDEQRLSILREHLHRRRTLSPSRTDTFWKVEGEVDHPHAMAILQLEEQIPAFVEGILVRRMFGCVTKNQLDVVQLPSLNRGTEMRHWTLDEKGVAFRDEYWIQPSFDLLVLLKVDLGRISFSPNGWPQANYEFHLRTLSENERHPSACEPVLRLSNQELQELFVVSFIGRLMLLQLPVGATSKLVIWDWITGDILLDKILESSGLGFAVVSDDLIAIARRGMPLNPVGSGSPCIGSFDVFRLDSSLYSKIELVLVGCFELPGINDTLISAPHMSSVFGAHGVGLFFAPEEPYSTTSIIPMASSPKVFETSNSERVLKLTVGLHLQRIRCKSKLDLGTPVLSNANFGRNGPLPVCSTLCIPIKAILDKISDLEVSTDEANHIIHWSEWGLKTRWIHEGTLRGDLATAGSRCVFPRFNEQDSSAPRCVASILEFHPKLQFVPQPDKIPKEDKSTSDDRGDDSDQGGSVSILGAAPLQPGFDSCFDDASRSAVLPYTMAELKHEAIANERPLKKDSVILMDEEHMVIIQRTPSGQTKGVAVLTF